MKHMRFSLILALLIVALTSATRAQQSQPHSPQVVDLKSVDGTLIKATYFAADKPGPGVLLFHQSNRTRTSWDDLARQLAVAGITRSRSRPAAMAKAAAHAERRPSP